MARFQRGREKTGGRKPGVLNRTTLEIKDIARSLLEDPRYQRRLPQRLLDGKLAPQSKGAPETGAEPRQQEKAVEKARRELVPSGA